MWTRAVQAEQYDQQAQYKPVMQREAVIQDERQERNEENSDQSESFCSKITSCFTGCFSCCGSSKEARHVEGSGPGFVQTWCQPNPYNEDRDSDSDEVSMVARYWVRSSELLLAGAVCLNTVGKIFLSVISCIPGSSSEFVRDKILNIDEWANKGLHEDARARGILPAFFTVVAVTINPYAEMEEDLPKTNCLARKVFEAAFECAVAGMERRFGRTQYSQDSGVKEFFQRHVVSRFLFLTATVLYVVEKIVHLGIGLILTGCAAATLFRDKDLNDQARKYLGALDVIDHACVGLRATLYPWQNLGKHDLSGFRDPVEVAHVYVEQR